MSVLPGHQVANMARGAAAAYAAERDRLVHTDAEVERQLQELTVQHLQAWEQLTVTLVPGLLAPHLDWAANLLHLPSISGAQVHRRMAEERSALETEIARIEADPAYVEREARINACSIHVAELERSLEPLRAWLVPLERDPHFGTLIESRYGTPEYVTPWYALAYYRHWKHGDQLVETFGAPRGLATFAALRERWERESAARYTLEAEARHWFAERNRLEALVHRHAELHAQLRTIEERHWTATRARVHEHLAPLEARDLLNLVASYEPGSYAAKRVTGIGAKIHYLRALQHEWLKKPVEQVQQKLTKAIGGLNKYSRPKHRNTTFDIGTMRRKYKVPQSTFERRWSKFELARHRILAFDRYDAYDHAQNMVWWHLMTGGEVKASFIPEVAQYYGGPHREDPLDVAAAALAYEATTAHAYQVAKDDWS